MAKFKWPFVEIHWEDITGCAEWCGLDDLPKLTTVVHRGWVVYEDDKVVVLSASYQMPEIGDVTHIGDACTIPLTNVIKRRKLNV